MVLFIFVIMLLNAGEEERTQGSRVAMILGVPGVLAGGLLIAWTLLHRVNAGSVPLGALPGSPKTIGKLLFHEFLLPFEITSVLVLIAIMGAVVLATRQETTAPHKEMGPEQLQRFDASSDFLSQATPGAAMAQSRKEG